MRKYLFIYKSELKSSLQYILNTLISFINYFVIIFIFLNLWKYIYSDPNEIINGYSLNQMIWYIIVTEILWSVSSGRKLCRKISEDVKGGNIAYNINKPYSYIEYALFSHLGETTINFVLYLIAGLTLGFVFLGEFPSFSLIGFIAIIISMILAIAINTLISVLIGLYSFKIEDSGPFYWLYGKLILVIGTIFPIEFFPKVIRPILNCSHIFAVTYGPAKLFVGFSYGAFAKIIIVQTIYLIVVYLLCKFVYKKGVKNLNVNGG